MHFQESNCCSVIGVKHNISIWISLYIWSCFQSISPISSCAVLGNHRLWSFPFWEWKLLSHCNFDWRSFFRFYSKVHQWEHVRSVRLESCVKELPTQKKRKSQETEGLDLQWLLQTYLQHRCSDLSSLPFWLLILFRFAG